ncbi:signal transduction histidine kinase [Actinocorallia herbida]|uniref:Oxygen sensor histidine kinase NreB n=1 Tax=Actinocorallia herbida TaxID=58109 RepID=A0A3N1CUK9_9ACTN|nr:sensor histidine kinase [Actinocorallia herbida]ROO84990.1 signal transduction histidine kinase [Actinocorallia herbida]
MNTLAPAPPQAVRALAWCLHLLVGALLALAAGRAVMASLPRAGLVAAAAAVCGAVYAVQLLPRVRASRRAAAWWLSAVGAAWLALLALSAEAVWLAFPLYFLHLHLLTRRAGLAAVAATAIAAITGFSVHQGSFGLAMAVGPALGAAVAVAVMWGYEALYRESERRRLLIEELTATRADLARAEHTAGVLAERERLAREIHDTLAQGLTSIQLLLRAAERALPARPDAAARHVDRARETAADNLAEARRFVAALSPPALEGTTLADALERLCAGTGPLDRVAVRFAVVGEPVPLPRAQEVALLRVAQSALANIVQHARAGGAEITLRYALAEVRLDISDDGVGFDTAPRSAPGLAGGGFGLAAMRARLQALGGTLTVASAPGGGTGVAARLPLAQAAEVRP